LGYADFENVALEKASSSRLVLESSAANELPLKILVRQDSDGKVWISYNSPAYLQQRHGFSQDMIPNIAVVEALAAKAGE